MSTHDFSEVSFRVHFNNINEAMSAGFSKNEITKVTESWTDPKTWEKCGRVTYYVDI